MTKGGTQKGVSTESSSNFPYVEELKELELHNEVITNPTASQNEHCEDSNGKKVVGFELKDGTPQADHDNAELIVNAITTSDEGSQETPLVAAPTSENIDTNEDDKCTKL